MSKRLRVNPILCEAHGVCAELLPELIRLDPWGYPILAPGPVPPDLGSIARRAVASCPALALLLEQSPPAAAQADPGDAAGPVGASGPVAVGASRRQARQRPQ